MKRLNYLLAGLLLSFACARNPLGPVEPTSTGTSGGSSTAPTRLTGKVLDSNGNPIAGAAVVVAGTSVQGDGPTATDGSYTISAADTSGNLAVAASKTGFQSGTTGVFTGNAAPELLLVPASAGVVQGTIQSAAGGTLSGAEVWVNDRRLLTASNGSGAFTISGITLSNPLVVKARANGYSVGEATVTVSTTNNYYTGVLVTLAAGGTLTGIVRNAVGNPISNARVTDVLSAQYAVTGASGNYSLPNMAVGTGTIRVSAPGYQTKDVSVLVTAGSVNQGDVVLNQVSGSLRGNIVNNASVPQSGVTVSILGTSAFSTSFSNGDYTVSDIPAGTYVVRVQTVVAGVVTSADFPGITINPGGTTTRNFVFNVGSRVSGNVTNTVGGRPIPPNAKANMRGATINQTIDVQSGFFDFGTIMTESVTITVKAPGFSTYSTFIALPGSPQTYTVNAALTPLAMCVNFNFWNQSWGGCQVRIVSAAGTTGWGNFNGTSGACFTATPGNFTIEHTPCGGSYAHTDYYPGATLLMQQTGADNVDWVIYSVVDPAAVTFP